MNNILSDPQAEIALGQEIPLVLSILDKGGNPVPGAVVSNVIWTQDNEIGTITPNTSDPTRALYVPSKAGTTKIQATATVTIP